MGNKMLIDAAHPEETRVVVVKGNRVEEFDFESQSRKQLRGSIFLAKVIRVEPSLQAAFVDYGGNRHGFLAFAEIHPDYYRIPQADAKRARDADHGANGIQSGREHKDGGGDADHDLDRAAASPAEDGSVHHGENGAVQTHGATGTELPDDGGEDRIRALEAYQPQKVSGEVVSTEAHGETVSPDHEDRIARDAEEDDQAYRQGAAGHKETDDAGAGNGDAFASENDADAGNGHDGENGYQETIESIGGEDALEELPQRERPRRRLYKIQEVIKRNQILLVQVVKEERGTKGAALTTYLSLAGRYTVLMPNTASGGGISRKIGSAADRKRLREIAQELDVPPGMGLIVRTAGAARTKAEIKRDFEYLLRLWENVRDLTLKSKAPTLVYEEGDLIKRSIRDLYNRDIDEVLVAGDDAYREAKDFMRMLMPSHAKHVQPYKDPEPIFLRYGVENQLNQMFNPRVTLKSGGYIVINQTEALVAIDVNSGKSTREHSIEETALKTNMEAAEEIARQLRLRDLAGLIVIDFIDMEEKRNNRAVERKLKDCLRNDRARIQVGRISPFGLLEMSRQRLRTGVVEGSTRPCHVCDGTGIIRSTESVALMILRAIEDLLIAKGPANLAATTSVDAALYILNNKRHYLRDIEMRYGVTITVNASEDMHGAAYAIEKVSAASPRLAEGARPEAVRTTPTAHAEMPDLEEFEEDEEPVTEATHTGESQEERPSRRRRRRRRGRNGVSADAVQADGAQSRPRAEGETAGTSDIVPAYINGAASADNRFDNRPGERSGAEASAETEEKRSRRSRRRGGQRQRALRAGQTGETVSAEALASAAGFAEEMAPAPPDRGSAAETASLPPPAGRFSAAEPEAIAPQATVPSTPIPEARPQPVMADAVPAGNVLNSGAVAESGEKPSQPPERRSGPVRGGWWQRRLGG